MNDEYIPGTWNALCDVCGFKFKSIDLRERWDGARVCSADFELRNEQDFIKSPRESGPIPWSRPEVIQYLFHDLLTENSETLMQEDYYLLGLNHYD